MKTAKKRKQINARWRERRAEAKAAGLCSILLYPTGPEGRRVDALNALVRDRLLGCTQPEPNATRRRDIRLREN